MKKILSISLKLNFTPIIWAVKGWIQVQQKKKQITDLKKNHFFKLFFN